MLGRVYYYLNELHLKLYTEMTNEKKSYLLQIDNPDSKICGAHMGPIWGRQEPGGPHVSPMNFAIWECIQHFWSYQWLVLDCSTPQFMHWKMCHIALNIRSY